MAHARVHAHEQLGGIEEAIRRSLMVAEPAEPPPPPPPRQPPPRAPCRHHGAMGAPLPPPPAALPPVPGPAQLQQLASALAGVRAHRPDPALAWPARLLGDAEATRGALAEAQQLVVCHADAGHGGAAPGDRGEDELGRFVVLRDDTRRPHVRQLRLLVREAERRDTAARQGQVSDNLPRALRLHHHPHAHALTPCTATTATRQPPLHPSSPRLWRS